MTATTPDLSDPEYRAGVIDLLGVLARGELTAFEQLGRDAGLAPSTADKAELAAMASAEYGHYALLKSRLEELGASVDEAMAPFADAVAAFHEHSQPKDWPEGLVKAYIGDGIAADFYREVATGLDPQTRELVLTVLDDTGHSVFVVDRVKALIAQDPLLAGRLALWGRRLVGEAIAQAQRVAMERAELTAIVVQGLGMFDADLSEIGRVFTRITENHTRRMAALGLAA